MVSSSRRSDRTVRLLIGNAVGMVAFVVAFLLGRGPAVAVAAAVVVGVIGYVAADAAIDAFGL